MRKLTSARVTKLARDVIDNDSSQELSINKRYYVGPPNMLIRGTQSQFINWCHAVVQAAEATTQAEVFSALNNAGADSFALCRVLGIAADDYNDVCSGKLKIDIPFL